MRGRYVRMLEVGTSSDLCSLYQSGRVRTRDGFLHTSSPTTPNITHNVRDGA